MTTTATTPKDSLQGKLNAWTAAHADLVDSGAPEAELQKSRLDGAAIREAIAEQEAKQHRAAKRQQEAAGMQAARERANAWSMVERLLRERHTIAQSLQEDLTDAAASLHELIELNQRVWDAMPPADRPSLRPNITLPGAIVSTVELFVFARSAGLMCKQGMSPHTAEQRPDIVTASKQLGELILSWKAKA